MDSDSTLQHHLAPSIRNSNFQIQGHPLHQPQPHASQYDPGLDAPDPAAFANYAPIPDFQNGHVSDQPLQVPDSFDPHAAPTAIRQLDARGNGIPQPQYHAPATRQYGLLPVNQQSSGQPFPNTITRLQQEEADLESPTRDGKEEHSHFGVMKLIENPPNLEQWRERLFNVDETITLTEDEFQTYFPHVDNVYSHRSTQKYKRKPFISHYWDCRLKGRPPGTPKSSDPAKKKRKRTARERDLCDVKIKITEYFPGAATTLGGPDLGGAIESMTADMHIDSGYFGGGANGPPTADNVDAQPFGVLAPSQSLPLGHPGTTGAKFYTIQRVNGLGGSGNVDNEPGNHRHTLEESDRVKKNSVQRWLLKQAKEKKKLQAGQKTYAKKATGRALETVKQHSKDADLTLYGSCFCPFVQRVWIALEAKQIPYQYVEVDPYKKPQSLLDVNPRGLVPAIRHGNWGCYESTVIMEYLEDLSIGHPLLPLGEPQLRAHCRLWVDHINRHLLPAFYKLLQETDTSQHTNHTTNLQTQITTLVNASHATGPFFLGQNISFVDIFVAPWILRLSRVLKYYRGWPDPEVDSRWERWVSAVEAEPRVQATTSDESLYRDSYERYAENRPNTSQLADAINAGQNLP